MAALGEGKERLRVEDVGFDPIQHAYLYGEMLGLIANVTTRSFRAMFATFRIKRVGQDLQGAPVRGIGKSLETIVCSSSPAVACGIVVGGCVLCLVCGGARF